MAKAKFKFLKGFRSPKTAADIGLQPAPPPWRPQGTPRHAFDTNNPEHIRAWAALREERLGPINRPTETRMLRPGPETRFVANAMRKIKSNVEKYPERPYIGEYGMLGDAEGNIIPGSATYEFGGAVEFSFGDLAKAKFLLHSHPLLAEPLTSSASPTDHADTARLFGLFKDASLVDLVTNGTEILRVNPHNMGLQKLTPAPGESIPVAFQLPVLPPGRHSISLPLAPKDHEGATWLENRAKPIPSPTPFRNFKTWLAPSSWGRRLRALLFS